MKYLSYIFCIGINLIKKIFWCLSGNHISGAGSMLNLSVPTAKFSAYGRHNGITLGKRVFVRGNSDISAKAGVGEAANVVLEDGVFVNRNCVICAHKKISIGEKTTIGPNTVIYDHDHNFRGEGYICREVKIGKNVWIGANCVILKGVTIGDNAVIGAGCVVSKNVLNNTICYSKQNIQTKEI